ncbi:hypothetical protein D3C71_1247850 [compost metagenome]
MISQFNSNEGNDSSTALTYAGCLNKPNFSEDSISNNKKNRRDVVMETRVLGKIKVNNELRYVHLHKYADRVTPALSLLPTKDYNPTPDLMTISVNVEGVVLGSSEVLVRDSGIYQGVIEVLANAGILRYTGKFVKPNHEPYYICEILK